LYRVCRGVLLIPLDYCFTLIEWKWNLTLISLPSNAIAVVGIGVRINTPYLIDCLFFLRRSANMAAGKFIIESCGGEDIHFLSVYFFVLCAFFGR
jgi:hypothetical protein